MHLRDWEEAHRTSKRSSEFRSRLVAKDSGQKSRVNHTEGVYAATPPLELVKFLLTNAAASSRRGHFRNVMLIDIGKGHLYAPSEEGAKH